MANLTSQDCFHARIFSGFFQVSFRFLSGFQPRKQNKAPKMSKASLARRAGGLPACGKYVACFAKIRKTSSFYRRDGHGNARFCDAG
jgi:hypothetical protein